MLLTVKDLERLQRENPDYQMELVGGKIIVMSPSGLESEEVATEITAQLRNWVRPRKLGRVLGSSAGYILPNEDEDVRAPDVSFIRAEKLKKTTPDYVKIVPDLIFEVKSKTDSLPKLREKIATFLQLGTQVGVLVDPRTRTLEVYRLGLETLVLKDEDTLKVSEVLPGWELVICEIWAPEFE
ncbi:protein of unknown function DUF820 [Gloeothece citriformis PCC 7424]|uniref:Putative restriction endonuclease domain-containing protein n=1 Tax=Gloeothece citriformis (strain PCC 7424) TaxID=65393 RepID=B7KL19_GLOC7|nr:Uma2 family endonuclease [Gloeothece citriformis]ACK72391.1 protein of unknown function DUF820 [Gloeothece citriformis PCC 7424]